MLLDTSDLLVLITFCWLFWVGGFGFDMFLFGCDEFFGLVLGLFIANCLDLFGGFVIWVDVFV